MHVLAGLDTPTGRSVMIEGTELAGLDDGDLTSLRRDKLGFVFQFFNLLPVLTAEENSTTRPPARRASSRSTRRWTASTPRLARACSRCWSRWTWTGCSEG